jgi:hypothetical protein
MPAIKRKLALEQGAVYQDEIRLRQPSGEPVDLTGCSARMHMRGHDGTLLLALSTQPIAGLVIDGPAGVIRRIITAPQTAALPVDGGQYDLEITPAAGPDFTWRLYQGSVTVSAEVTRD